ncbi:hypothetical protein [Geoalkalibacter halelectricus]|uniref:hypothetical protein n=1 Tax=Geoalkalibacter halelectricus TaxID=2847045 RepID=UPI003D22C477
MAAGLVLLLVLFASAALVALWQNRTPLLNTYLKPYVEERLGAHLEAQVRIERLELEKHHLRIGGLTLEKPGRYRLFVLGLSLDFSAQRLRRGEIDGLRLFKPELFLDLAGFAAPEEPVSTRFSRPPLNLDLLRIAGGRVEVLVGERLMVARDLELEFRGLPEGDFDLALILDDARLLALRAAGRLDWEDFPEIRVTTLDLDGHSLLPNAPLRVYWPPEGIAAGGEIGLESLDSGRAAQWLRLLGQEPLWPEDLHFFAKDLRLGAEFAQPGVRGNLSLSRVNLSRREHSLSLENLELRGAGDLRDWQAQGGVRVAGEVPVDFILSGSHGYFSGEFQGRLADVGRAPELLEQEISFPVSGGLEARANFVWRDEVLELSGVFSGTEGAHSQNSGAVRLAPLSGHFQANGPLGALAAELAVDLAKEPFMAVRGDGDEIIIQIHRTPLAAASQLAGPSFWPQSLEKTGALEASLRFSLVEGGLQGHGAWSGGDLRVGEVMIESARAESRFDWRGGQLVLSAMAAKASLGGQGVWVPRLAVAGEGRWRDGEFDLVLSDVQAQGIEYISADDMSAVEGGFLQFSGSLSRRDAQPLRASLRGRAQVREVLIHSFYGDFVSLPADFAATLSWNDAEELLIAENLFLALSGVGTLEGEGRWRSSSLRVRGRMEVPRLEEAFGRHLQPLLSPLFPLVGNLELSGAFAADFEGFHDSQGRRVAGRLLPSGLSFSLDGPGLVVDDLGGHIPFVLSTRQDGDGETQKGYIAFSQLHAGPLSASATRMNLTTATNRLAFVDPWELDLAGGSVHLEQLRLAWEPQGLYLAGRTRILGIDLEQLTQALDAPLMHGSLAADLGEFEYAGGFLQSQGEARLEVFGGGIRVRNLRAQDIFSSYRSFEADIDLHGLDLAQLTQTFEFGEINGIIDGYIHDLRLFGRVPSAFIAEITTRDRGRRNISVKAINNLAVISQGGLSAVLSRGIYRFIDFYRYRRIGIFCALRNDVFVLRGTARPGSDLYLVEGGLLPPRIDVLAPQSAISFREMLRRLGRIDRAGTR